MNRNSIPTFVGVFVSLLVIGLLHRFIVVDDCLDHGGVFNYENNTCLLTNGQLQEFSLVSMLILLYAVVGFVVSYLVATTIRKYLKSKAK